MDQSLLDRTGFVSDRKDQISRTRWSLVDLALPAVPDRYVSRSQRARVATEAWALENLYCPRCSRDDLTAHRVGQQVVDFGCHDCRLDIQLKAKAGRYGKSFANSAYEPKLAAIRARKLPDYALMSYDLPSWRVTDLTFVPGHFIGEQHVIARRPLSATARRAGWVGSNVRIGDLPPDAFVHVVESAKVRPPSTVREQYSRFEWLKKMTSKSAGWTSEVLNEVRALAPLKGMTFSLTEFYAHAEPRLAARHPENKHVRDKIRQQLQRLREQGFLKFERRGLYRVTA